MDLAVIPNYLKILGFIYILLFLFGFVLIEAMTRKRGNNLFNWIIFSILFTPMVGAFFLLCLGETDEARENRIKEEVGWRIKEEEKLRRKEERLSDMEKK